VQVLLAKFMSGTGKRAGACQQFVGDDAERVDVGGDGGALVSPAFWPCVGRRIP
jgi:hypothetical protein